jgi:DNA-binding transcriptional regulator YdaS (Cro superfamily)
MDTLHSYFKALDKDEREKFATAAGTSVAYIWQIIYGQRRCKEGLAIEISKAAHGAVSLHDLRPDVDWEYVRNSAESVAGNSVVDRAAASDDVQPPVGGPPIDVASTESSPHGTITIHYTKED